LYSGPVIATAPGDETSPTGVSAMNSSDMTKQTFVTMLNNGIAQWRESHTDSQGQSLYDDHGYGYQPANYPKLAK